MHSEVGDRRANVSVRKLTGTSIKTNNILIAKMRLRLRFRAGRRRCISRLLNLLVRLCNVTVLQVLLGAILGCFVVTYWRLIPLTKLPQRTTACRPLTGGQAAKLRVERQPTDGQLLIGIMTAQVAKYSSYKHILKSFQNYMVTHPTGASYLSLLAFVDDRAWAIWRSWAPLINGRVIFFAAENTTVANHHSQLPIVRLKGVDDTYPPQKKAFMMLAWMADYGLKRGYQWFMRADDDVYIRADRLHAFLASIDHNRPHMLGRAGFGAAEEIGMLSLSEHDNYCMGGPGVFLSRETLRQVRPHLADCTRNNIFTTHEDTEVSRCITKHVGIYCSWNLQMKEIFLQSYETEASYSGDLNVGRGAITFHPVKTLSKQYRLHDFFLRVTSEQLAIRRAQLMTDLRHRLTSSANETANTAKVTNKTHTTVWELITNNQVYCTGQTYCPSHRPESHYNQAINELLDQVVDLGKFYRTPEYVYRLLSPLNDGVEYIFKVLGRAELKLQSRHIHAMQPFGPAEIFLVGNGRNERIHIIMPLSGRAATFRQFANQFRSVCLSDATTDPIVSLIVVVHLRPESPDDAVIEKELKQLVLDGHSHPTTEVRVVDPATNSFSRASALMAGSAAVTDEMALLFFLDVDLFFTADVLYRVQKNTIRGVQAFFPIMFNEYAPETWLEEDTVPTNTHFLYGRTRGFFRDFSFGMASMYKSDLMAVGGFDESVGGWGGEDVQLFEKFLERSSLLRVLRAPEPGLVHVYHPKRCNLMHTETEEQLQMCLSSRAAIYGHVHSLAERWFKYGLLLMDRNYRS